MKLYQRRDILKSLPYGAFAASSLLLSPLLSAGEDGSHKKSGGASSSLGSTKDKILGIAFLGCAHIHVKDYINHLKERSDIQVVAAWDSESNRAEKVAKEIHNQVANSVEEILQNNTVHAVIIASETIHHFSLIELAIKHNKHIFVEKPLTIHSRDAQKIVQLLKNTQLTFHCNYHYRTLPALQELGNMIHNKILGDVIAARVSLTHRGYLEGWFNDCPWMIEIHKAGFGGFGDEGAHAVDLLGWIFGAPSSVFASIKNAQNKKIDVFGDGLLFYPQNLSCSIAAGWICETYPVYINVGGTQGSAYIHNNSLYCVESKNKNQLIQRMDVPALPPKTEMGLALFLDNILNKKSGELVGVEEAARNVVVLENLYASAEDSKIMYI